MRLVHIGGTVTVNADLVAALVEHVEDNQFMTTIHFSGGGTMEVPHSMPSLWAVLRERT
jgi:hypothetical protein